MNQEIWGKHRWFFFNYNNYLMLTARYWDDSKAIAWLIMVNSSFTEDA